MAHAFTYSVIARTTQVRLMKGADIDALPTLDQKDWLILSCPVQGLGEGRAIGQLLDTDNDGRIRVNDINAAIQWLRPRLASFDLLFTPATGLTLSDINPTSAEGAPLCTLFQRLAIDGAITTATIDSAIKTFYAQTNNGDGVVKPTVAGKAFTAFGEAILALTGGATALDGTQGIDQTCLKTFLSARDAALAWHNAAPKIADFPTTLTPEVATAAVQALAPKIDAFFTACDMVRYNPAAQKNYDAPTTLDALLTAPICLPSADTYTLPFERGINPVDLPAMATIATLAQTLQPDASALDLPLWTRVKALVQPFATWAASKPAHADTFTALTDAQRQAITQPAAAEAFRQAIASDAAEAPLATALGDLRRLVMLRVDFLRLLRNFVNVEDLYPPTARALFQVGTLYMDGRACTLCFPISQAASAHAAAAKDAACCLAYCTLTRPAENKTQTICAVFTAGTTANLAVGRNGLFYDLQGNPWDATITHLVPASIGLLEAFFAPWRKIADTFKSTLVKFIGTRNDDVMTTMTSRAETAANTATTGVKPNTPPADPNANMASIATFGIALSFFATALTGILSALTNTPLWKTGCSVLGFICLISLPNVLLTWLKLRARNLAAILNASGWAVNRRIGLTPPLGRYFTQEATLIGKRIVPKRLPKAPKPCKRHPLLILLLLALLTAALWYFFCPTSPRQQPAPQPTPTKVAPKVNLPAPTEPPTPVETPAPVEPPVLIETPVPVETPTPNSATGATNA